MAVDQPVQGQFSPCCFLAKNEGENYMEQLAYLKADLSRWKVTTAKDFFYAVFEQGVWATIFYRLGRMLYLVRNPVLMIIFRLTGFFLFKFSETFLGVSIPPGTDIGPGLYLGHTYYIRIHPKVKIGSHLNIGPDVIIGQKGQGVQGVPVIGDHVYIGCGAKILGPISLGSHVTVGANAVVIGDVPNHVTVVGIPARIIQGKGAAS
jgi:serine O-acetyltransferase